MEHSQRARLYLLATACLALYLGAQILQLVLRVWILPAPGSAHEEMLARLGPAETLRATVLLLSHFCLVPVYVAVALRRWGHAPGAAACGVVFGAAFVLFEVSYRTVDLFLVSHGWAAAYTTADAGARTLLLERTALWEQAVGAWYFALLAAHLLASIGFLVAAARRERGAWDLLLQLAFALNALRLIGRILASWPGMAWLKPLSGSFYFPPMASFLLLLIVWLARQAFMARRGSGS
jgi:hypothetical protein